MSITFDTMPPRAPRRSASDPPSASLLNRIQKPPLVERLSRDDSTIKAPSGPRAFTGGPVRNRPSRGGSGSGSSVNTNASIARAPKGPKKPKTAAELDQELDAFMGDADVVTPGDTLTAVPAAGDVDMA
jgi:THO complex subunit 4